MPGGSGEPDAAAIVGAIEACTGTNRSGEGIRRESQNLERGAGSPSTELGAKNSPGAGRYFMARSELVDDERCGSW